MHTLFFCIDSENAPSSRSHQTLDATQASVQSVARSATGNIQSLREIGYQ